MRGFDPYLTTRVDRAAGDHYYFAPDTLRWFDAFGGRHMVAAGIGDGSHDVHVLVESIRDKSGHAYGGQRRYRAVVVTFFRDENAREHVDIRRTGTDYATSRPAERDARELAARVSGALPHGVALNVSHAAAVADIIDAYAGGVR